MKISVLSSTGVTIVALLLSPVMSHRAYAFGGFWSSKTAPVKQTAEEILFVDNPDSTITAVIQIKYAGSAQKFVWVIPVPGRPKIGVSSTTAFGRLEAATAPEYLVGVTTHGTCKQSDDPKAAVGGNSGTANTPSAPGTTAASVMKVDEGSVGPYDYVDIKVDRTLDDPAKLATDWLVRNGYDGTTIDESVLGPYLKQGLNLLAVRLTKGTDVGSIKPLMLTYESKLPTIPIRLTSVSAQGDMGVLVWVIGPSQAVPDNYKALVLNEARIEWLTAGTYVAGTLPAGGAGPFGPYVQKPSNYDALVIEAAREAGGQAFVTELGGPASQYREKVWSALDEQQLSMISKQHYKDGIDAIFAANVYFGGWDGWREAIGGATTLPRGVTIDEFAHGPGQYRGTARVDATKFFRLLREKVIEPVTETAALLYKAPYLTRLYTTLRAEQMTLDPVFNYNGDLAQVTTTHIAEQTIECGPTVNQRDAPWRVELPHGGAVAGKGSTWPVAEGSMPANLKTVVLSTSGSGTVVKDNAEDIGTKLFKMAGPSRSSVDLPHPPQNGVMIGGIETVTQHGPAAPAESAPRPSSGGKCNVSRFGAGASAVLPTWTPLAIVILTLRRRRRDAARRCRF